MAKENYVKLSGTVANDKHMVSSKGSAFVSFGLPLSKKKQDGTFKTVWINCVAFGEKFDAMVVKGAKIIIEGYFDVDEYQGKTSLKLVANNIDFADNENGYQQFEENQTSEDSIPF